MLRASCLLLVRVGIKNGKLWNEKKQSAGWDLRTSPGRTRWVHVPFGDLASLLTCLQGSGVEVLENLTFCNPFSFLQAGGILLLSLGQGSEA